MREERLAELYDRWAVRVHAYALRHCGLDGADDIVSETFLVAWRRIDIIPDDALPWLLVVARNTVAHWHRTAGRRSRLENLLLVHGPESGHAPSAETLAGSRLETIEALGQLSAKEREALLLIAWDGLTLAEAAMVAGCRERAFRARLTRARTRLHAALDPQRTSNASLQLTQEPLS